MEGKGFTHTSSPRSSYTGLPSKATRESQLCRVVSGCVGLCRVVSGGVRLCRVVPGCVGLCRIASGCVRRGEQSCEREKQVVGHDPPHCSL